MGHGYVRANYGCNCYYRDSAFKRYNRAHGDTTIFNINYGVQGGCCGGHKTGFWGGLGTGIGYSLGNWLMGGLNLLGGWCGFGGMSFGGFGNWGFGGIGGGSGLSTDYASEHGRRSSRRERIKTETVEVDKPDSEYTAINTARELLQKLQAKTEPVTDDEIKALEEQINALKSEDGVNDNDNKKQIEMLKIDFEKLKAGKLNQKTEGLEKPKSVADVTADDILKLTNDEYNKLSDADKKALADKVKNLPEENRIAMARNAELPADLRIAAKQSFYRTGYTNANLDELTDDEIKKLKEVIDESEIADFTNIKLIDNIQRDENGKLKSFKMTAQSGTQVTYVTVNVVDGELIFHGRQESQNYALQKDTDGQYHLMQYKYHDGYGIADVRNS